MYLKLSAYQCSYTSRISPAFNHSLTSLSAVTWGLLMILPSRSCPRPTGSGTSHGWRVEGWCCLLSTWGGRPPRSTGCLRTAPASTPEHNTCGEDGSMRLTWSHEEASERTQLIYINEIETHIRTTDTKGAKRNRLFDFLLFIIKKRKECKYHDSYLLKRT